MRQFRRVSGDRMTAIKRDERIGGQRLILGDCAEVMQELDLFDLLLTDPPFGIDRDKGMGAGGWGLTGSRTNSLRKYQGDWDSQRPDPKVIRAALALASVHIIWGGQFFADILPAQGKWLFWDKCQTMPSFGDGELAWTSLDGNAVKQFTYNGNGLQAKEKDRFHPTQKPIALMEWCLGFAPQAQTILDPFGGSGSTAVAAQRMGKCCTIIERDPDHFQTMCRRVDEATRQKDLFIAPPPAPKQESLI
jgi:DNA modification methylase